MSESFELHERLTRNGIRLGSFPLCLLLLMNDANYPWFILVPQRPNLRELIDLSDADQQLLLRESNALSRAMLGTFRPDKLNVAALGNVVPQLHIHHIARKTTDRAWPDPVWGKVPATPYSADEIASIASRIRAALGSLLS